MGDKMYSPIPNNVFFEQVITCLKEGKKVTMNVQGNSMFPFVCHGDSALLSPVGDKLRIGDIVLADTSVGTILHRIIDFKGILITLSGDGNIQQTEETIVDQVFGILVRVSRGKASWDISSPRLNFLWKVWVLLHPVIRRVLLAILKRLTSLTGMHYENKR